MTTAGEGLPTARVMVVGEVWGEYEERERQPFVGASGQELNRMLHEVGLTRSECYLTNLVNARPPFGDVSRWITAKRKDITPDMLPFRGKWVKPLVLEGFAQLLREIHLVQPDIIICVGNSSMWALTGADGIQKWRGSQLRCTIPRELYPVGLLGLEDRPWAGKLIPTFHPTFVLRDFSLRPIVINDLKRAVRERHSSDYANEPAWNFLVRPSFSAAADVLTSLLGVLNELARTSGQEIISLDRAQERMLALDRGTREERVRLLLSDTRDTQGTSNNVDAGERADGARGDAGSPSLREQKLCESESSEASDEQRKRSRQTDDPPSAQLDPARGATTYPDAALGRKTAEVTSPRAWPALEDNPGDLQKEVTADNYLWIDFDLETRAGHIACAGLSWSKTKAMSIPMMCVEDKQGYWLAEEEARLVWLLYLVLTHPQAKIRWQNGLYDAQYTYRWWHFTPRGAQDTMIAHHSAFCGLPKSLAFQASMYCDHYVYWKDDGKTWSPEKLGEDQLWRYNCIDAVRTRECGEVEAETIERLGLQSVDEFQQAFFWPVLQCMQRGIAVDKKARSAFALELQDEMAEREAFFARVLGHPLNPRSPVQMSKLFYDDLQQPKNFSRAKKGTPGHLTCDDEALSKIAQREPILRPLIKAISEYRSLGVFLSTFVLAPLDTDGRMRTSYNICGTETFRFSSSENAFGSGTNLQNIPKGGEDDEGGLSLPNVRKIFIPDPGFTIFDTDLSKADLRIVTWESDEPEMKAMLKEGRDPYVEIAREFYKDPSIKKTRDDGTEHPKYRTFKSFAHGCITAGHEVLTPVGWVPIEEYNEINPLAVWNAQTRAIHFEVPVGMNRDFSSSSEPLVNFSGQGYSQEVTHDHRMPYTTDPTGYKVCAAIDVPGSARLPVAGFFSGKEVCDPNAMRLIAAFQADGSFDYKYRTRWHLRKQRKVDRLISLAKAYDIEPQVDRLADRTTTVKLYWRPADFMKVPGPWLLELDGASLDAWLDELQYWDGHIGDTGAVRISTASAVAAEWIQTIAHLRGKGARRQVRREASESRQALWQVSLNNRAHAQVSSMRVINEYPTQATPVYCPKTSTGFFLVRRAGHVSITGNTHYLGTPHGLASRLGLSVHQADTTQRWYFGRFPRIKAWQSEFCATLRSKRYVQNIFGYRRYYFDRVDDATCREAIAWLPQSTVALYINRIWMNIYKQYPHIWVLLQVHDSLVGQFPSHRKMECLKQLEAAGQIVLPYDDPLIIPVGVKTSDKNWGDCG